MRIAPIGLLPDYFVEYCLGKRYYEVNFEHKRSAETFLRKLLKEGYIGDLFTRRRAYPKA